MCDPDSIADALVDAADIDVLVNNAGFEVQGAIEMIDDELMHRQLDTKVLGPLRVIRSVMPAWRERGHGVIVNVSSVVGRATSPFGGAYAASKHALEAMSEALHWEASSAGIRVRVIEPGRFPTTDFGSNIVRPPTQVRHFRSVTARLAPLIIADQNAAVRGSPRCRPAC